MHLRTEYGIWEISGRKIQDDTKYGKPITRDYILRVTQTLAQNLITKIKRLKRGKKRKKQTSTQIQFEPTGVLISPQPEQEGNNLMFLSEWREFRSAPCLAGKKKNLMTARVSMSLKLRASLTCFRACFLPGRAKDLSAPGIF